MEYCKKLNAIRDLLKAEFANIEVSDTYKSDRFAQTFTISEKNKTASEHANMLIIHILTIMILSTIVVILTLALYNLNIDSPLLNSSFIMTADRDHNNSGGITEECRNSFRSKERVSLKPAREYYDKLVFSKSDKYNVEPSLVSAMIQVESNWNYKVISRSGAIGLMQLMPATAKAMDVKDPLDPEENIEGGIKYLRYLLDRFDGDLTLAIAAYNAGPTKVRKYNGIPPIRETRQYVKRVLTIYNGSNLDNKIS
jgi:soluble lytic murein transglycosylase-like protein